MPEKPAAEKTEQPSPRKLRKAREKGQVPQSQELPSAVSVVVLVLMLALMAPVIMNWLAVQMKQGMLCESGIFTDSGTFIKFINTKIVDFLLITFPVFAVLTAGSVLACVAVGGLNFAPQAVNLKLNAINPVEGFQKLINGRSAVRLCISIAKLLFISIIVWVYLRGKLDDLAALRWAWSTQIMTATAKIILGLCIRICIALLVIATIDVFYQRWKYIHDLKMTRQELKEDHKETYGSPQVKGRIRRIQIEMAKKRMLQEVPKANVVLVNPTHVAVALRYEAGEMDSPVVVAKGAGLLAEKIREIARAYGVPVIRRPELARTIFSTVEINNPIPQNLYVAVAEVLALIYRLRHRR